MLPDRVSNPGPLTYESGALPIALRGPAVTFWNMYECMLVYTSEIKFKLTGSFNLKLFSYIRIF